MNHRSLVFDLFGGYVRYDDGVIALQDLAAVTECFGVAADPLRVIMSRLRREGWFEVTRSAGRAQYRATERTWRLLDEGYERIFRPTHEPWSGEWYAVIYEVPESSRGVRDQLRKQLAWLGFGPLAASVWLSPHDRLDAVLEWAGHQPVRISTLVARSRDVEQDRQYVARCWDLDGIQQRYLDFLDKYSSPEGLASWQTARGGNALVERVHLVHEYRLFLFRDPQLPAHLLPEGWAAEQASALFTEAYDALEPEATAAYRSLVGEPAVPLGR
jgi:phenylacetic acid degradation operon negative regulatory protein